MRMKFLGLFGFVIMISMACTSGREQAENEPSSTTPTNIKYAGARSSHYGIHPFPEAPHWKGCVESIKSRFSKATGCLIWILGTRDDERTCRLEFPGNGNSFENIVFSPDDIHEAYLSSFDEAGIKVFLQVEPMHADVPTLIDLVLSRYRHHPCVVGFGIDVEWYREADKKGWGVQVDDASAAIWENRVKTHQSSLRLFLKHWDRGWMPPTYRGEIIFFSDSQQFKNLGEIVTEFTQYWAAFFYPNPVYFQIGYPADRFWWRKLADPVGEIGTAIASGLKQECGIFWVDFTLREICPQTITRFRPPGSR